MHLWWHSSHDWHAAMNGCSLLVKDGLGWQGGGFPLLEGEQSECVELCLSMGDERAKGLLNRTNGQNNTGNIVLSVLLQTSQEEEVGEAFFNNWRNPCA